ncbi:MAG TPA: 3-hydroxyacyl-CoA dehydrogenase NAD-binding domain-containing protein [Patescibacteria group bacterium]|nr:3-hydroxyacyl-CoA dehydrogenase NAD-binding domain-containing protein [Patescibacteria group bacterium]
MELEQIREIGVIGSGTMGPGIALAFARHGYRVRLCDQAEEALRAARSVMSASLKTMAKHGLVEASGIRDIEDRVDYTTSLKAAAENAGYVAECITENPEAKRGLFRQLGEICAPGAIFASNTSFLNIFELVPEDRLPNTVIAHWFAPPHILPLVEVVREPKTSGQTERVVVELLRAIGKTPVVIKKYVPGFVINRIQRIIGREVLFLLDNGYISPEDMDLAVKASLAPRMMVLGLVQRYDFTGLDLSARNLENEQKKGYLEAPVNYAPRSLVDRVRQGHLGVKTGKGFYDYGDRSREEVLAERDEHLIRILQTAGPLAGPPPAPEPKK